MNVLSACSIDIDIYGSASYRRIHAEAPMSSIALPRVAWLLWASWLFCRRQGPLRRTRQSALRSHCSGRYLLFPRFRPRIFLANRTIPRPRANQPKCLGPRRYLSSFPRTRPSRTPLDLPGPNPRNVREKKINYYFRACRYLVIDPAQRSVEAHIARCAPDGCRSLHLPGLGSRIEPLASRS